MPLVDVNSELFFLPHGLCTLGSETQKSIHSNLYFRNCSLIFLVRIIQINTLLSVWFEVSSMLFLHCIFLLFAQEPSGNHTPPQLSPSLSQSTFTTGGSLDVPHIIMQGDARRRRNENYFDDIPRSKLERQMAQVGLKRCH